MDAPYAAMQHFCQRTSAEAHLRGRSYRRPPISVADTPSHHSDPLRPGLAWLSRRANCIDLDTRGTPLEPPGTRKPARPRSATRRSQSFSNSVASSRQPAVVLEVGVSAKQQ